MPKWFSSTSSFLCISYKCLHETPWYIQFSRPRNFLSRVCLSDHLFLYDIIGFLRISLRNGCCCTECHLLIRNFFVRFGDLELLDSIVGKRRKGLELLQMIYSYYQNTMGLQLIGCSYDKKSANVVMWKDKVYEYISSAWNNNNEELTILRLRNVSRKECWAIVYGVGTGPLISIIYKRIHYNNNNNNNNNNNLNNNNKI